MLLLIYIHIKIYLKLSNFKERFIFSLNPLITRYKLKPLLLCKHSMAKRKTIKLAGYLTVTTFFVKIFNK